MKTWWNILKLSKWHEEVFFFALKSNSLDRFEQVEQVEQSKIKILLSHWWKFKFWLILTIIYFYIFILGLCLLHDGTIYAIFNSGLLGLSLEGLLRRNWLLLGDLFARYWNFCPPTSVIFHGLISLHLSFSRQLSPKVQPKPLCKYDI